MPVNSGTAQENIELARLKPGAHVTVRSIDGGWELRQRLNQMGIHIGDHLIVKQAGAFHGPMLVETNGSHVALGCGMARKIWVHTLHQD